MCCFEEALQNCTGMMDPYGDMPLAGGMTASAEIDIIDTENGVHVSVVKTPPRNGKIRLSEVIESIMGGMPCETEHKESVPQKELQDTSEKQGDQKQNDQKDDEVSKNASPDSPDRQSDKKAFDRK